MADWTKRCEAIKPLDKGGQAQVHLVRDKTKFDRNIVRDRLRQALGTLARNRSTEGEYDKAFDSFYSLILSIQNSTSNEVLGALKAFHAPSEDQDIKVLRERMRRETEAIKLIRHRNIVELFDVDPDSEWFVSKYYQGGNLHEKRETYTGDLLKTLQAIRPVVECVSLVHQSGLVHRDINPKNIFLEQDGSLILADFGIVFRAAEDKTRLSKTFMGSQNWAAPWVNHDMPVDAIPPTADVFSLGKVIWAMLTGQDRLP